MTQCPNCAHVWQPAAHALTARQREVLDFILLTMASKRHAPSLREIGDALGLRSPATVHEHVQHLTRKGYLYRDYNKPRAVVVA